MQTRQAKKKAAALDQAAIIKQEILNLEARKAHAVKLMGHSSTPAFEAALSGVDCSLQSLRQRLSELDNLQK